MKQHLPFVAALGICFLGSCISADAQQGVRADTGGIAIGGNVSGSTINIGIPQAKVDELVRDAKRPLEELTAQQRENIALLKEKLDLNLGQVRAALNIVGEKSISPENVGAKLVEIAERFKELQATASAQPGDSPAIVSLKAQAEKAIEAGELAKADALLADVEAEQRRALDRLAVNAAETSARRGEIALTRLRYLEAANHFANAAAYFPNSANEDKRIDYLNKEVAALVREGLEFGNNDALRSAIDRVKRLIDLNSRDRTPIIWAIFQHELGIALYILGERESGTAKLEEAIGAFREALKEVAREREPREWVAFRLNLGNALSTLGMRDRDNLGQHTSGTRRLEEAVALFREVLSDLGRPGPVVQLVPADPPTQLRETVPLPLPMRLTEPMRLTDREFAATQSNLGFALYLLGTQESGTSKMEEALAAFREALKGDTRARDPSLWATTQRNLGNALLHVGRREEAVAAYREALKEMTRERRPLNWALTQFSLGNALLELGTQEASTAKLEEAGEAFRAALLEHKRERVPRDWAVTQANLGQTLLILGQRESATAKLEGAVGLFREALKELTRERWPRDWATTQANLGNALLSLGERETGTANLEEAIEAFRELREQIMRDGLPLEQTQIFAEGVALMLLAERRRDATMAEAAFKQINTAIETMRDGGDVTHMAHAEGYLVRASALVARLREQ